MRCLRSAVAGCALLIGHGALRCQTKPDPKPPPPQTGSETGGKTAPPNSSAPANQTGAPAPAEKFPYPGEGEPAPDPSGTATRAPDSPAPAPAGDAPKSFPYPGDPEATKTDGPSSSSSSSSSSSPGAASGEPGDTPVDPERPGRRKLPRQFHPQSSEDRATEDLNVARFYRDKGNLHAAYLRAQDAVKTLPNDPETHFLLGQIAQETKHREEAVTELNTYLRLEPDGDHLKEARRRLAQLR